MNTLRPIIPACAAALCAIHSAPALGQSSNVDPASRFSWSENCGWMNWRDAGSPTGSQGARFTDTFASGFVWMENTGWLNLGGSPANGTAYANTTGADSGVNIAPDGALSGFAWGENIGWVNFTLPSLPAAQQPRLDFSAGRLRGYAWGENIGWINLDAAELGKFVVIRNCAADFNADGNLDPDDLGDYINCYFSQPPCPMADFNADGNIDPDDLGDFINAYFAGCP
ncbi:MAG: hypothetical protein AB7K52_11790 [Phycisphaerales bacterium]